MRRAVVVTLVVTGALAVAGAGSAVAIGGDRRNAAPPRATLPPATAQVVRGTLTDAEEVDGTLGYGPESAVTARGGKGTLTWLPTAGAVVRRGEPLYRVDDVPVLVLYGTLPAYRDLAPGVEGADVRQFERELRALGYTGFTVDDEYTAETATAVRRWQKKLGLERTGTVTSGRVVFVPAEVRVATVRAAVGDAAQGAVLTYGGTSRVVTVRLDVRDQRLATTDAAVSVALPDGRRVDGTVTTVTTVIEAGTNGGGDRTKIEVTVALPDQAGVSGYDRATVDVRFTVAQRRDVLSVPVAALLALAEGGYGVQVVDGSSSRIVRVETGLFSGGRVEVSGAGLDAGTAVGVPA